MHHDLEKYSKIYSFSEYNKTTTPDRLQTQQQRQLHCQQLSLIVRANMPATEAAILSNMYIFSTNVSSTTVSFVRWYYERMDERKNSKVFLLHTMSRYKTLISLWFVVWNRNETNREYVSLPSALRSNDISLTLTLLSTSTDMFSRCIRPHNIYEVFVCLKMISCKFWTPLGLNQCVNICGLHKK